MCLAAIDSCGINSRTTPDLAAPLSPACCLPSLVWLSASHPCVVLVGLFLLALLCVFVRCCVSLSVCVCLCPAKPLPPLRLRRFTRIFALCWTHTRAASAQPRASFTADRSRETTRMSWRSKQTSTDSSWEGRRSRRTSLRRSSEREESRASCNGTARRNKKDSQQSQQSGLSRPMHRPSLRRAPNTQPNDFNAFLFAVHVLLVDCSTASDRATACTALQRGGKRETEPDEEQLKLARRCGLPVSLELCALVSCGP